MLKYLLLSLTITRMGHALSLSELSADTVEYTQDAREIIYSGNAFAEDKKGMTLKADKFIIFLNHEKNINKIEAHGNVCFKKSDPNMRLKAKRCSFLVKENKISCQNHVTLEKAGHMLQGEYYEGHLKKGQHKITGKKGQNVSGHFETVK